MFQVQPTLYSRILKPLKRWSHLKPQIEKLFELLSNHTIIAWDPPGYGKSLPPERHFDLHFFQKDAHFAVDLIRALGKPKFFIQGWSDGGITGIIVVGRFVQCVENKKITPITFRTKPVRIYIFISPLTFGNPAVNRINCGKVLFKY